MDFATNLFSSVSFTQANTGQTDENKLLYLNCIPDTIAVALVLLELGLRKKRSYDAPPSMLVFSQFLGSLLSIGCLALLLFQVDTDQVTLPSALDKIAAAVLWGLILYSYQLSYHDRSWALTQIYTLKVYMTLFIPLIGFRVIVNSSEPSLYLLVCQMVNYAWACIYVIITFVLWCKNRKPRYTTLIENDDELTSFDRANLFERIFMIFPAKMLRLGKERPLEETDIEKARKEEHSDYQKERIKPYIEKYVSNTSDRFGLLKVIYSRFRWEILRVFTHALVGTILEYTGPAFILLIDAYLQGDEPLWKGFGLAAFILISKIAQNVNGNQFGFNSRLMNTHISASIGSVIFEKALKVSSTVMSSNDKEEEKEKEDKKEDEKKQATFTYGKIVNLMQDDLGRLSGTSTQVMHLMYVPLKLGIGLYMLFTCVKWQGSIGSLGVMVALCLLNLLVGRKLAARQKVIMEKKDKRMKFCTELLHNIKIFKLYNWEKKIGERVQNARAEEVKAIITSMALNFIMNIVQVSAYLMMRVSIPVSLALSGQPLKPGEVLAALSVVGIVNGAIQMMPGIINGFVNMMVSLKRIQDFLRAPECSQYFDQMKARANRELAIGAYNASFAYDLPKPSNEGELQETKTILKELTFSIKKGEFVAVVGRLGSGKSSIIQALIENMQMVKTDEDSFVFVNGSIAYLAQESWIQNTTIKNNITFGSPLDEDRYKEVVRVSQLESDIAMLPGRDLTEIGERGINLSGGQKTRVALARAVYSNHDILLLDDPLSAVDAHVGNEIFQECFLKFMRKKTRVLITNNQQYLPYVDRILVLNEGKIVETGTYQELMDMNGYFMNEFLVLEEPPELGNHHSSSIEESEEKKEEKAPEEVKIIGEEEREYGKVDSGVFITYYHKFGGWKVCMFIVLFMLLTQVCRIYADLYIGSWTVQSLEEQERLLLKNVLSYSIATFLIIVFRQLKIFSVYCGGIRAAKLIFRQMLKALMNAPINKYYDITPVGRILNRFSKDQGEVDGGVFYLLDHTTWVVLEVVVLLGMCVYIVPYILIVAPLCLYLAYRVQQMYLPSSREIMRMDKMSHSPIIHHFSETLHGARTIRAFGYETKFMEKYNSLYNNKMKFFFADNVADHWLGIMLEFSSILVLTIGVFILVGTKGWINAGMAALLLSYIIGIPGNITALVFCSTIFETQMISVERTDQIAKIEGEAPRKRVKDSQEWPTNGQIEFKDLQMKYRDNTDLVLRGVTATINPMDKVGIVGRTGSGKSSIFLSMFRIVEAFAGSIVIDGVDISELGLNTLRRKLCVIPQDPTMFQGTLRENIDPFNEYSDEKLKEVVKMIQLFPDENLDNVLEKEVSENGSNFSMGQRQLICFARAIVKDAKIMVLDEATASFDYKTDELIQKLIREKFADKTILAIAHRINTIMDYDKILVLDKGKVAEFDTPKNLMEKRGLFYKLVKKHKKI